MERKYKIIYSRKIVNQLMELGFHPVDILPNPTKPEFYCWSFEWTEEFDKALGVVLGGLKDG